MHWNAFFVVMFLVFGGAFVGMQYGFIALTDACPNNSSQTNATLAPNGTATGPLAVDTFSCTVGWVGVFLSVVTFGSFALPMKSPPVLQSTDVGPMGFQIYMSMTIVLTSFLVLITQPWSFTWFGTASAALWVPTSLLSLVAVKFIGISVGQSIWAGVTVIVSFIWGVALFGETPASIGLSILGLLLILAGIVGLSVCNSEPVKRIGRKRESAADEQLLLAPEKAALNDATPPPVAVNKRGVAFGLLAALGCGLTNGTMLVPATIAQRHGAAFSGQGFIVSFGIGVAIVTTTLAIVFYLVTWQRPILRPSTMALPAMTSGVLWSIGNYGSIFAAKYLGLAVGFSLTQTALLVGGIWGLTLLREIRGVGPILLWAVSALVLLAGAAVLSVFGHS